MVGLAGAEGAVAAVAGEGEAGPGAEAPGLPGMPAPAISHLAQIRQPLLMGGQESLLLSRRGSSRSWLSQQLRLCSQMAPAGARSKPGGSPAGEGVLWWCCRYQTMLNWTRQCNLAISTYISMMVATFR